MSEGGEDLLQAHPVLNPDLQPDGVSGSVAPQLPFLHVYLQCEHFADRLYLFRSGPASEQGDPQCQHEPRRTAVHRHLPGLSRSAQRYEQGIEGRDQRACDHVSA